jgi:hypothetical protein
VRELGTNPRRSRNRARRHRAGRVVRPGTGRRGRRDREAALTLLRHGCHRPRVSCCRAPWPAMRWKRCSAQRRIPAAVLRSASAVSGSGRVLGGAAIGQAPASRGPAPPRQAGCPPTGMGKFSSFGPGRTGSPACRTTPNLQRRCFQVVWHARPKPVATGGLLELRLGGHAPHEGFLMACRGRRRRTSTHASKDHASQRAVGAPPRFRDPGRARHLGRRKDELGLVRAELGWIPNRHYLEGLAPVSSAMVTALRLADPAVDKARTARSEAGPTAQSLQPGPTIKRLHSPGGRTRQAIDHPDRCLALGGGAGGRLRRRTRDSSGKYRLVSAVFDLECLPSRPRTHLRRRRRRPIAGGQAAGRSQCKERLTRSSHA